MTKTRKLQMLKVSWVCKFYKPWANKGVGAKQGEPLLNLKLGKPI